MKHHTPPARHAAIVISILLSLTLLLAACGGTIETDLTLHTGDRFDATSRIVAPAAGLALVGGTAAIESGFRQMEQQAAAEGARFSWRKESSRSADEVVYRISISGAGYQNLADFYGINVQKTQYQGQEALSISANPNYDLSGMQNTVRIHVSKILQTNNRRADNNTIVWTGMETLQAIVTPVSTNWPVGLLVVLAVAAAILIAFFLFRPESSPIRVPETVALVTRPGGFCPYCGRPTPPGSKFCMHCGQAIPPRRS